MSGIFKTPGSFTVTPHKVSICILLQIYAPAGTASQNLIPISFPFSSIDHHNRSGLFLFALTRACDDFLEPKLDHLLGQFKEIGGPQQHWVADHLFSRLSSLSAPDDLFNFFSDMREILGGPAPSVLEDAILDSNSNLGMFLRRCILAFDLLSFEGVCHLLKNIETYCKEYHSGCPSFELPHLDGFGNVLEASSGHGKMKSENLVLGKISKEMEARKRATDSVPFHMHAPRPLQGLLQDIEVSDDLQFKHSDNAKDACPLTLPSNDSFSSIDAHGGTFLRTNRQVQGFLMEQADAIEKHGCFFPLNAFEINLRHLQKLAPELHRAHFLRYVNNIYHDDYPAALENLHRYFDYSAGTEGFDYVPPSFGCHSFGRYEIALLCLGMLHFHFGHPSHGLEVLTEAVRVSQQHSNDSCLAYTLAAICNLLSEIGISRTTGILGSSSPLQSMGPSLSIQQQLFVILRRSLHIAESLKLRQLVASNFLAMAKFDLTHVQRPLLSFGPKASMRLRTCPVNVCKELRLCSQLMSDFGIESTAMKIDGTFSTGWLKNLKKPMRSSILLAEYAFGNDPGACHFFAQPSSVPNSVTQTVGSSYLLRATAWEIYGSAPLARINALVFATCFADSSSMADISLSYVKLIQQLAIFKGYKEAFAALKIAEGKFLSISKSRMQVLRLQLLHDRALHRGHLKAAHQLCDELGVMVSPVAGVDMELKMEANLRRARTLLAAKQFNKAAATAQSLFCTCYKFNMQVENASILLLLAEIHKKAGNAVLGVPYALASLSFCQSFNLDLLKASATLTLAELWLSLGSNHAKKALTLIHGAFAMILGHGGLEIRARAYIAEAKCYMADPCFSVSEDSGIVLGSLKQAAEVLEALEYHEVAAEAFYLMANAYDQLGNVEEREVAAASFKNHILALEHPQDDDSDTL